MERGGGGEGVLKGLIGLVSVLTRSPRPSKRPPNCYSFGELQGRGIH